MERRNFAALCAAVLCFWLFALAFGTAQAVENVGSGRGVGQCSHVFFLNNRVI